MTEEEKKQLLERIEKRIQMLNDFRLKSLVV